MLPKRRVTKQILVALLIEARRLANQTVRSSDEVAAWHRKTDRALQGLPGDTPTARYDAPAAQEHRAFVNALFNPARRHRDEKSVAP